MAGIKNIGFKTSSILGTQSKKTAGEGLASLMVATLQATSDIQKIEEREREKKEIEERKRQAQKDRQDRESKEKDLIAINDYKNRFNRAKIDVNFDTMSYDEQQSFYNEYKEQNGFVPLTEYGQSNLDIHDNEQLKNLNIVMNKESLNHIDNYINENWTNFRSMEDVDLMVESIKSYNPNYARKDLIKKYSALATDGLDFRNFAGMTKKQILDQYPLMREIQDSKYKKAFMREVNTADAITNAQYRERVIRKKFKTLIDNGETRAIMSMYGKKLTTLDSNGNKVTYKYEDLAEDYITDMYNKGNNKAFKLAQSSGVRIKSLDSMMEAVSNGVLTDSAAINKAINSYMVSAANGYNYDDKIDDIFSGADLLMSNQPSTRDDGTPFSNKDMEAFRYASVRKVIESKGNRHKLPNNATKVSIYDRLDMDNISENQTYQMAIENADRIYGMLGGGVQNYEKILSKQLNRMNDLSIANVPYLKTVKGVTADSISIAKENYEKLGKTDLSITYSGSDIDSGHSFGVSYKVMKNGKEVTENLRLTAKELEQYISTSEQQYNDWFNGLDKETKEEVKQSEKWDKTLSLSPTRMLGRIATNKFSDAPFAFGELLKSEVSDKADAYGFMAKTAFDAYRKVTRSIYDSVGDVAEEISENEYIGNTVNQLLKESNKDKPFISEDSLLGGVISGKYINEINQVFIDSAKRRKEEFDKLNNPDASKEEVGLTDSSETFIPMARMAEAVDKTLVGALKALKDTKIAKSSIKQIGNVGGSQKKSIDDLFKKTEESIYDVMKKNIDKDNIVLGIENKTGKEFNKVFDKVNGTNTLIEKKVSEALYKSLQLRYPKYIGKTKEDLLGRIEEVKYLRYIDNILPRGISGIRDVNSKDLAKLEGFYEYLRANNKYQQLTNVEGVDSVNFMMNLRRTLNERYGTLNKSEIEILLNQMDRAVGNFR